MNGIKVLFMIQHNMNDHIGLKDRRMKIKWWPKTRTVVASQTENWKTDIKIEMEKKRKEKKRTNQYEKLYENGHQGRFFLSIHPSFYLFLFYVYFYFSFISSGCHSIVVMMK